MTPKEKQEQPKKKLKRIYKLYKAGLISEEDLTQKEKILLSTYYGIK